jgi:hypothetical protein
MGGEKIIRMQQMFPASGVSRARDIARIEVMREYLHEGTAVSPGGDNTVPG